MKSIFVIFLVAASLIFGSTSVVNMSGIADGNLVKIQWQTTAETNIKEFIIEKSSDNINFESFTTETAKGSNSTYSIIDSNIYSKNTTLYYRIIVEDYDGTKITSEVVSVMISTAGISATWGSIKAMFR
ncbi:MAG: hypothetical protein PF574_08070 [Candidatus Delongbacteria bacterium]|jgi:hypothetical protein|nr:hypothetical protein [Candidatus Delongbacteria bacterium]